MLRNSDKFSLTLVNARDINGNILPFSLKLPLNNDYSLPEKLVSVDVFENHEGLINGGHIVFTIYLGRVSTINDIVIENKKVKIPKNLNISSIDSPICIQNVLGEQVAFATLNKQDIVLENNEQLVKIIEQLSDNFKIINDSVVKIRTLSKTI